MLFGSSTQIFDLRVHDEIGRLTGQTIVLPISDHVLILPPRLRIFHYIPAHFFLPRDADLDQFLPLDVWILAHAVEGRPLSYPHLLSGGFLPYRDPDLQDPLPLDNIIFHFLFVLKMKEKKGI
ncbi:unnamed protein product [Linum trigynum]|uniref:Uncharacterized protein n=1 Tax=Linum trigynum TaxID=586398 RepID=A0AAV2FB52_9ROSI